jgi:hypothetical protein
MADTGFTADDLESVEDAIREITAGEARGPVHFAGPGRALFGRAAPRPAETPGHDPE